MMFLRGQKMKYLRITKAPPVYILKGYGGSMTIEEYRKSFENPYVIHTAIHPSAKTKVLPAAWQLLTIDKTKEVKKFTISTGKGRGRGCVDIQPSVAKKMEMKAKRPAKSKDFNPLQRMKQRTVNVDRFQPRKKKTKPETHP